MGHELFAWDNDVAASTVTKVASTSTELKSKLTDLVSEVNKAAADGQWEGFEQETFDEIFQNWQKAADGIFGVCEGASKLVDGADQAVTKYREEIMKALG